MKRKIEIFTANCPICDPVVKIVKDLACGSCELTVYDLVQQCENKECINKAREYGISKVPSVVVDGKLLSCCQDNTITKEDLLNAGIGQQQPQL